MVGEGVLHECLRHPGVESVLVIGRTSCNVKHQKLTELLHQDFFDLSRIEDRLNGYTACFFCLGVSSVGMNEQDYSRITYDLTMHAATVLSRLNPGMTFCYVSGAGTNEHGGSMWSRVKGKTESHLTNLPFKAVYLFRPGYIKPTKGLKNAFMLARVLGWIYPILHLTFRKYVCTLEDIGLSMIHAVETGYHKQILECKDISLLAHPPST